MTRLQKKRKKKISRYKPAWLNVKIYCKIFQLNGFSSYLFITHTLRWERYNGYDWYVSDLCLTMGSQSYNLQLRWRKFVQFYELLIEITVFDFVLFGQLFVKPPSENSHFDRKFKLVFIDLKIVCSKKQHSWLIL